MAANRAEKAKQFLRQLSPGAGFERGLAFESLADKRSDLLINCVDVNGCATNRRAVASVEGHHGAAN